MTARGEMLCIDKDEERIMRNMRRTVQGTLTFSGMLAALLLSTGQSCAQDKIKVVATFSILADFVRNVGGDRIAVRSIVGPDGNTHVYSPTPDDMKAIAEAKIVFVNGLGFEGWMDRLIIAARPKAPMVTATRGIQSLTRASRDDAHSDHDARHGRKDRVDPHAWQSVANAKVYVTNIRDALAAADPEGTATYEANANSYLAKLDQLDRQVRAEMERVPMEQRRIITAHRAFDYFGRAYGVTLFAPQGTSMHSEPSAQAIAGLIVQIRKENIRAVFLENIADPRLLQQIADETGAKIGGTLYSDALSPPGGPAPTYFDLIRNNVAQFARALAHF
jgi:zinc/manganese transport system substrate-binding protein